MTSPLRAVDVFQNAQHLDIHRLRPSAFKYGVGNAPHAGVNLADRDGLERFSGFGLGREEAGKSPSTTV